MEALRIEATEDTPGVHFDPQTEKFQIDGTSRPEHTGKFFAPITSWLEQYLDTQYFIVSKFEGQSKTLRFEFELEYFNSTSAKYFLDLIKQLKAGDARTESLSIEIVWKYNAMDEDIHEAGQEFESMAGIPFTFQPIED